MSISCSYKDCPNVQRSFSSKTFFNLPTDDRREIWIKNSGNEQLQGISSNVRRIFCEDHFDLKYLRRQFNRTILRREAVPFPFNEIPETQEIEYIEMAESEEETELNQSESTETSESAKDQNKVIIVLNKTPNARNQPNKVKQNECNLKSVDIPISKPISKPIPNNELTQDLEQDESLVEHNKEVEVDFIFVEENEKKDTNDDEQSSSKKIRLDIEPTTNRLNEPCEKGELTIVQSKPPPLVPKSLRQRNSMDGIVSSSEAFDSSNEETYFALSLLGTLRRLTPHKRAIAKCHILSYLTELEYGSSSLS